jgi:hypothetical protein
MKIGGFILANPPSPRPALAYPHCPRSFPQKLWIDARSFVAGKSQRGKAQSGLHRLRTVRGGCMPLLLMCFFKKSSSKKKLNGLKMSKRINVTRAHALLLLFKLFLLLRAFKDAGCRAVRGLWRSYA